MKRISLSILLISLLAASAPAGPPRRERDISVGRSASGVSLASGKRLTTNLGGSIPVVTFTVKLNPLAAGDSKDGKVLNAPSILPAKTGFEAIYPNPTNPFASIRYALAEPSGVRLSIYAVDGRLIRTLVDEERAAGIHVERWDGKNAGGLEVSSGLYLVRLHAAGRDFTSKVIVAR